MSDYRFSVIVPTPQMTHDQILDATEALGNAGCMDASIRGHVDGMELLFERAADSLSVTCDPQVYAASWVEWAVRYSFNNLRRGWSVASSASRRWAWNSLQ